MCQATRCLRPRLAQRRQGALQALGLVLGRQDDAQLLHVVYLLILPGHMVAGSGHRGMLVCRDVVPVAKFEWVGQIGGVAWPGA